MAGTAKAPAAQPDRLSLQHGIRTALAAGLSYWLAELLHMPAGYWATISAIVVMQSEVGATLTASRERIAGTAIGSLIGWGTTLVWHGSIAVFAFAVLVVMLLCSALRIQNAGRLGGVTVAVVVLIPRVEPISQVAFERFLEVSFGIVVSVAVMEGWNAACKLFAHKP